MLQSAGRDSGRNELKLGGLWFVLMSVRSCDVPDTPTGPAETLNVDPVPSMLEI